MAMGKPKSILAHNIRLMREERGLTQRELVEMVGVYSTQVSRWECGVVKPEVDKLPLLAAALQTTTDALFGLSAA
jgi:transcriptional regulator with XRE-family HTH domain